MLPIGEENASAPWDSFEQARSAIESIEPHRTTAAELSRRGLDPQKDPNIVLLHYSDILRRFPLSASSERLDAGLRECLEAGRSCTGYALDLRSARHERVGPFVLDLLGFRRETKTVGWTFNAVILMVDGRVVYTLYGGKPAVEETSRKVEPLGPLQDFNAAGLVR